jgi:tape measure domain-containing protein
MSETLTIVLKADGSGLTGTVRASAGEIRKFGIEMDRAGKQTTATGERSRRAARDVDALGRSNKGTSQSVNGLARGLNTLNGILATLGISVMVRETIQAGLAMDRLERSTASALGSQRLAGSELAFVRTEAQRLGIYFPTLAQGYAGLAAATRGTNLAGAQTREIFLGVAESGRAMNLTTDQMAGVMTALQQIAGKGTLSMEELRQQLGDRLPGAMQIAARSMNLPVAEFVKLVSEGKVVSEDFLPKFAAEMRKAAATGVELAKNSPAAEFERLKTALFFAAVEFTRGGLLAGLGKGAGDLANTVNKLVASGAIEKLGASVGALFRITVAWFLLYRGIPAVVAGLNLVRNAYIGIGVAQLAATGATVRAGAAALATMAGLKAAVIGFAGVLFSAFAGWQIGTWARKEFIQVELAGIALVTGLLKGWEYLKQGVLVVWAGIKAAFFGAINAMRGALADFVGQHAAVADLIPDFMGGGAAAKNLRDLEAALRPAGTAAADMAAEIKGINAAAAENRQQIDQVMGELADYAIEQNLAKKATQDAAGAEDQLASALATTTGLSKEAAAAARKLAEARRQFGDETARMRAQLEGPAAQINLNYEQDEAAARRAELAGEASAAQVQARLEVLGLLRDEALAAAEADRDRADAILQANKALEQEIRLGGLSNRERAIEEQVIAAVNQAREDSIRLRDKSLELDDKEIAKLRHLYAARSDERDYWDAQAEAAKAYENMWLGAIDSVAAAAGDFITRGIKSFSDFGDALKDIARRFVSDIIREIASTRLKQALAGWVQQISGAMGSGNWMGAARSLVGMGDSSGSAASGSGGSGMGWISGLKSAYSGFTSGFSAAGTAGGGFWSSMISGFSGAVSSFTGSLGAASTATTAYGSTMSSLTATYAAGGPGAWAANGGVSAAGLGAAQGVAWVPIVGWIVAGIMASAAAFKGGWDMQGQKTDISKWMLSKGNLGGAIDNAGVALGDNLLKAIGFSDSWAAAFSGSGLQTKLFGHKKPKVQGQGIQGSIGFGGIDGESYADIKAKGGWFRSDKKWTETGTLDSTIAQAFDNASMAISMRADDLAQQMGVDITAALDKVSIDIGKIEFDKDPEKARQQITDKIGEVMESLSAEAVKALGFVRLLDDGFAASEIMGALSASIVLVTGGVDRLGKSLSALEIEHVTKAVEYFESMAIKNGSSLGDQIAKTVGLLDEYAALITDVDTQLQTRDLNQYQAAQLQIELQYRSQIKSANQLAKALGLTGARAEDLAKIEQLRAVNMASLQTQMEAQKNTFLEDLGLGDLSTLRDDQKRLEAMALTEAAVAAGDMQRAQQVGQQFLGFSRNLNASGRDYQADYDWFTDLMDGMTPATMDGFNDEQLDRIASLLEGLPQGIASAMFQLVVAPPPPPAPITPWTPPTQANPGAGGSGSANTDKLLQQAVDLLAKVAAATGGQLDQARSDSQDARINGRLVQAR